MKGNEKKLTKKKEIETKKIVKSNLKNIESTKIKKFEGKKKVKRINNQNELYLYSSAITILLVLSNAIMHIPFDINGVNLYLSIFTYPFIFLFTSLIYKKYGFKENIESIIIAIVIQLFMFFLRWIMFEEIEVMNFIASSISLIVSQLLFIFVYRMLLKSNLEKFILLFLIFAVFIILDNVIFLIVLGLLEKNGIIIETLNLSNTIKVGMAFLTSLLAYKMK